MYARELMEWLHERLARPENFGQTLQRFESLRNYGLLPKGRHNARVRLSDEQIANAVLSFGHSSPGYGGHASLLLGDLRPVGGEQASFLMKPRLKDVVATLIGNSTRSTNLQRLTLSSARDFSDDEYTATIHLLEDTRKRTITYVTKYAHLLQATGSEQSYNHEHLGRLVATEISFGPTFFRSLSSAVSISRQLDRPFKSDWKEFETEEEKAEFNRKLGARQSSNFLNLRVDAQIVWPKEPIRIKFGEHYFVLFPKTAEYSHSISVDLRHENLSSKAARSLINQMLSIMSWCNDQPASVHEGWSGSSTPSPVLKQNLAFVTASEWYFSRSPTENTQLKKCLAFYRDGLNALSVGLASHAVLSFFRVIETKFGKDSRLIKNWINENASEALSPSAERFQFYEDDRLRTNSDHGSYIYKWCRVATAHAALDAPSDPDAADEIRRLLNSAEFIRYLARAFISKEFNYSNSYLHDDWFS